MSARAQPLQYVPIFFRLPVVQGGSSAYLGPAIALLRSHGTCPIALSGKRTLIFFRFNGVFSYT